MAVFTATISFELTYRASDDELVTRERADGLAGTMLAVLRGSPKIRAIAIEPGDGRDVEALESY